MNKQVNIMLGMGFVILTLMIQPVKASELSAVERDVPKITYLDKSTIPVGDGREDAMCSALYITAIDQFAKNIQDDIDVDKNTAGLEYYNLLNRIVNWQQIRISMNASAYAHQVEFYMNKMDTSLALLHYDRCWHRVNVIYAAYKIATFQQQ